MDNIVSAGYYKVRKSRAAGPEFEGLLKTIFRKQLPAREKDLNPGRNNPTIVRLERLADDGANDEFLAGELIRKQVNNIPPEVNDQGLEPIDLPDGAGIGYSSAFRFHKVTHTLLIQSNPIAVTQSRLGFYLYNFDNQAEFEFEPLVKKDAWVRFNHGQPRRLSIRLASPIGLPELQGEAETVSTSAANLAEALGAPMITLEVSMGQKKGSLAKEAVRRVIRAFKGGAEENHIDVRSLTASVVSEDGTDKIDFLDEFLGMKEVFDLPSNNPERNYNIRRDALRNEFGTQLEYITNQYGERRGR